MVVMAQAIHSMVTTFMETMGPLFPSTAIKFTGMMVPASRLTATTHMVTTAQPTPHTETTHTAPAAQLVLPTAIVLSVIDV